MSPLAKKEVDKVRQELTRLAPTWVKRQLKRMLPGEHVRYSTSFSDLQWVRFLCAEIDGAIAAGASTIVLLHRADQVTGARAAVRKHLSGSPVAVVDVEADPTWSADPSRSLIDAQTATRLRGRDVAFVACSTRNADVQGWLGRVLDHPEHREATFIFKVRPGDSMGALRGSDRARPTFVSSVFDDDLINDVYRFSITKVEPKYDVRDAYDLYQALLASAAIPGAVCEFGSYRGHSGLILSEAMARLNLDKPVFLCDMFEGFPPEQMGVDRFWNDSHFVDFDAVTDLFRPYDFVTLVKGDFNQTLSTLPIDQLSLVHVDCDSYRAVELVTEFAFPKLSPGGVMVYEDYGHDFCLGARAAVDDFYRSRTDCFRFFSGYSGLELVVKR